jgi:hypothetical protein
MSVSWDAREHIGGQGSLYSAQRPMRSNFSNRASESSRAMDTTLLTAR